MNIGQELQKPASYKLRVENLKRDLQKICEIQIKHLKHKLKQVCEMRVDIHGRGVGGGQGGGVVRCDRPLFLSALPFLYITKIVIFY